MVTNKEMAAVLKGLLQVVARSRMDVQGNAVMQVAGLLQQAEVMLAQLEAPEEETDDDGTRYV